MRLTNLRLAIGIAALCLAMSASADDPKSETSEKSGTPEAEEDSKAADPDDSDAMLTVYVPPSRGSARARTGGGTRGVGSLSISVLAPDHVGLTLRAQPSLGWFASKSSNARVDFTLLRDGDTDPLVEVTLEGPIDAGIHFVHLTDLGVQLEQGATYEWSIALVTDPDQRDLDVVAGGVARLAPPAAGAEAPSHRDLAQRGVWYDAIAALSEAIAANPGDAVLRSERAQLLEQVGLGEVAAHERARAGM